MRIYYHLLNRISLLILALATILDGLIVFVTIGFYLPKLSLRVSFWRVSLKCYRHAVLENWKPKDII